MRFIPFFAAAVSHSQARGSRFFAIRYADRVTFGISPTEGGMT